jgi:hypothetical protein
MLVRCTIACKHRTAEALCGKDEIHISPKGCEMREGKVLAAATLLLRDMRKHAAAHSVALQTSAIDRRLLAAELKDASTQELLSAFVAWLPAEGREYRPDFRVPRFHLMRYKYLTAHRAAAAARIDDKWLK